jgi:hypothetical protein
MRVVAGGRDCTGLDIKQVNSLHCILNVQALNGVELQPFY